NRSPLGSGALAATPFPIDRRQVARALGFGGVTHNSMDAVAARDHVVEVAAAVAIAMSHLSRLAEEIVLWASTEFGFVHLDDAYCTGSSIMPQKKNPDVAELVRGKCGRAYGNLMALLTVVKGLPLAYNKDLQEDKEPLFDSLDTARDSFQAMAGLIETADFDAARMRQALEGGFLTATDLADWLVEQGVPFREAHRVVGELVAECVRQGIELHELSDARLAAAHPKLNPTVRPRLDPIRSVRIRDVVGGPAPRRVRTEVARWKRRLGR
ncbi:MAG: argininosuccinate lyase, partial [Deltaproteobacteria bacterium]